MNTLTNAGQQDRIQVLHVVSHLDVGGAELRLLDLARQLDWSRFQLHFCVFSGRAGHLANEIRDLGGKFHFARMGRGFPASFKKILRQQKIDTVHAHMHYSAGYVLRLAAKAGVPGRIAHFQSCSDGNGNSMRRVLQRRLMRYWIDRYATNIISCGENAMVRSWRPDWKSEPRCRVIFDGIDPEPFTVPSDQADVRREFDIPNDSLLFIHVGNIRRPKNHGRLISIFAKIVKKTPTARLLLVGRGIDDNSEQEVREKIAALGLVDQVIFAGLRTDVPRLLQAADAMIFPSLWEGLPGAVMEACAASLPVLASKLPEIKEIADWLPLVHLISLEEEDHAWAEEAIQLAQMTETNTEIVESPRYFRDSPFHINACMEAFSEVWSQTSQSNQIPRRVKAA